MQHIHILGICGTFMGSLAQLAQALGYKVTGSDLNVYPPMSTQLEQAGITLFEGWGVEQLETEPDMIVVGNVISRGNPVMEAILDRMLPYTSGPEWLAKHILQTRWVLAVAGTHGKTTTASMLAYILDYAGMDPGFLIGGVPNNFDVSARLGSTPFFVIEADEYDSAFFDKRSKFIHYHPNTLIMNNLEYDHADIFPDLAAIERQFHHLVRTVPNNGLLIVPSDSQPLARVLEQGRWTPVQTLGDQSVACQGDQSDWQVRNAQPDGGQFDVWFDNIYSGQVKWSLTGEHNVHNALAALAAARHVGVEPSIGCEALSRFKSVKRRMEILASFERPVTSSVTTTNSAGISQNITVYDDFAHHPTAIQSTLEGLRANVKTERIIAIIEPRSNTMKQGVHEGRLIEACEAADMTYWYQQEEGAWSLQDLVGVHSNHFCYNALSMLIDAVVSSITHLSHGDIHIVVMSNGGFEGIHHKLIDQLKC